MTTSSAAGSIDDSRPARAIRRKSRQRGKNQASAADRLAQVMSLVGVAMWTALSRPLELIALDTAGDRKSPFLLVPELIKPGSSWLENVYPSDRKRVQIFLNRRNPSTARAPLEYRLIVGEGEPLWVRHWVVSSVHSAGRRRRLQGVLLVIQEQKHLQWEFLRASQRERNRLGQDLHDDLCQVLAGLACIAQSVARRAEKVLPALTRDMQDLQRELLGVTTRVRSMAHGLFPAQLDYVTLREALVVFARQAGIRLTAKIKVDFSGRLPPHSPDQILHIYRIVQEAVGNAVRHGKATKVHIFVAAGPHQVTVRIEDDGVGFPDTELRPEGIGLHAMQYRAGVLAGELRFRNASRRGAIVELTYSAAPPPLLGSATAYPHEKNQNLLRR